MPDGKTRQAEGKMEVSGDGGDVTRRVDGRVEDAAGNFLGSFYDICKSAFVAWQEAIAAAGVSIEPDAESE